MGNLRASAAGPVALALVGAVGWLTVPAATGAAETARPAVFDGRAAATAARLLVNTDPAAVPVATLVDLQVPEASSAWDSAGTVEARASSVYPGATGTGGLQLICEFSGGQCPDGFPPDYPFTAFASYPAQPEASTPTGFAQARADRTGAASEAEFGNVVDLSPLADVVTLGSAVARTSQRFADDGTLLIEATTTITDVVLGGGALTIDVVTGRARAEGAADGSEAATTADASLTIAGMRTAAGEVVVGDRGVTIGGQGTDGQVIDQLNAALEQALAGTGTSARVLGVETDDGGPQRAGARTLGLRISAAHELDGPDLPEVDRLYRTYLATVVLGEAGTTVFAAPVPFGTAVEVELPAGEDPIDAASGPPASLFPVASGAAADPLATVPVPGEAIDEHGQDPLVAPPEPGGPDVVTAAFQPLRQPEAMRQLYAILVGTAVVWLVGSRALTRRLAGRLEEANHGR